jgi:hypothetical protein
VLMIRVGDDGYVMIGNFYFYIDIERSHGLHFVRNINHNIPVKCISFNIKRKVNMIYFHLI